MEAGTNETVVLGESSSCRETCASAVPVFYMLSLLGTEGQRNQSDPRHRCLIRERHRADGGLTHCAAMFAARRGPAKRDNSAH